jgi:rubredoxin
MGCCASRDKGGGVPYAHPPHLRSSLKGGIGPGSESPKVGARVSFNDGRNEQFEFDPDAEYGADDNDNAGGSGFGARGGGFTCPKCTAAVAPDDAECPGCGTGADELRRLNQQAGVKRRLSVSGIKLAQKKGLQ